jgi:hypothetical protein
VHQLRRDALRSGEKVRIERELHDELRLRAPRELRVEDFVTEGTEIRRTLDTPQEVGAPVQHVRPKRRLEDDVGPLLHCRSSVLHKRFGAAVVRNLRHLQPFCFERGKVLGFVRVAFLLDQQRRLVVLGALQRRYEVDQPQRCDMLAFEERDKIGSREEGGASAYLHGCVTGTCRTPR